MHKKNLMIYSRFAAAKGSRNDDLNVNKTRITDVEQRTPKLTLKRAKNYSMANMPTLIPKPETMMNIHIRRDTDGNTERKLSINEINRKQSQDSMVQK